MRATTLALVLLTLPACGASSKQVRAAKSSAYQASTFIEIWDGVLAAVATDYPVVRVLDGDNRRIVTCWRPIEKSKDLEIAGAPGSSWYFYRAIIEISPTPPYRVSVSGRTAQYRPPQIYPFAHGDVQEPGWVEGRTDRLVMQIHDKLAKYAMPTDQVSPAASDPGDAENVADTCIIRAAELQIDWRGVDGIVIGEPGAAPAGQVGPEN
jgi:hypothetical protein